VHGGWCDPIDEYLLAPAEEYFDRVQGRFFASGHTHVQTVAGLGDATYCNPGSVGQPRDDDPTAAFATFDDSCFEIHRVEYDIGLVGRLMDEAGFNGYYYGCLKTGSRHLRWADS